MTKIERTIYNAAVWLFCATSGKHAYRWPTKYGRPIGEAVMRMMVTRSQARREKQASNAK